MLNRQPYADRSRKLVLAYDVGTTFSGASYWYAISTISCLSSDVGAVQSTWPRASSCGTACNQVASYKRHIKRNVMTYDPIRYPGQVGGDAKIPTILYYDKSGDVRAAGAETSTDKNQAEAAKNGWTKAEW